MSRDIVARDRELLDVVQREAFTYFQHETNPENGLVRDKTRTDWPASIAAVGLALASYPVGVETGCISRSAAVEITLATLRFFERSATSPDAAEKTEHGFYYHFLDMDTGRRANNCEVSTVDTALLLAGALTAAAYFTRDVGEEREIRALAETLYARADWRWAQNGEGAVSQGWLPESGFIDYRYQGYDEALILYLLGLGAEENALSDSSYESWSSTYEWKRTYDIEYLYSGPLFVHQLSHVWVDFRGVYDGYMRKRGIDYFENSRRAVLVQQRYAIENPLGYAGYGEHCWGISASDGPGPIRKEDGGVDREYFDYLARGVPLGPDDGTIAPWSVIAALPFAPDIVIPTVRYFNDIRLRGDHRYGFIGAFNQTFRSPSGERGWVSPYHFGLNEGPIVIMIENDRTGLIWELMRSCPYLARGMRRAGFSGGWLEPDRDRGTGPGPRS